MNRLRLLAAAGHAAPTFVNGIALPGNLLDAAGDTSANNGRAAKRRPPRAPGHSCWAGWGFRVWPRAAAPDHPRGLKQQGPRMRPLLFIYSTGAGGCPATPVTCRRWSA